MKNYQDNKCVWGYITLCDNCAKVIADEKPKTWRHIHVDIIVEGFSLMEKCEACGCK